MLDGADTLRNVKKAQFRLNADQGSGPKYSPSALVLVIDGPWVSTTNIELHLLDEVSMMSNSSTDLLM